ncbi:phage tail protein [Salmonella enterica subsp. enterica serovar Telelkebir]|nr:phage tail protein [Salmonella enterica subsp. enterica serovar Telelkebir]
MAKLKSGVQATSQIYAVLTDRGAELEAAALATGVPVTLSQFCIGDANGQEEVTPDPARTALIHEVYRGNISASTNQDNQVTFKLDVPTDTGGYTIREVGILTDKGELYSVARSPDILKPTESNGALISITYKYMLAISSTSTITVVVNNDYLTPDAADKKYLQINENLSEIKDKGAASQKETRENIGINLDDYYTAEDIDNKFTDIENELNNSDPVLTVNDIKPDDKGNVNTASGYPLPNGDGAFNFVSVFATVTPLSVISGCDMAAAILSNSTGSGDAIMYQAGYLPGIWTPLVSIKKSERTVAELDGAGMAQRIPVGSISKITNIKNPYYPTGLTNVLGVYDTDYICFECDIDGVGTGITFASYKKDAEEYGRQLYQNALSGEYGVVANG